MKYSLSLPVHSAEYCTPEAVREMATLAEAVGFSAVSATEHPFPSRVGASMGGHNALDPVVCMSFVAAYTKNLRLHFNAFVPPYRNPFLAAKSLGDLDVMSNGRVIAGVVAGYLAGEFAALGASLEKRAAHFDEALVAMKAAWTGEPVNMTGDGWVAQNNVMLPRPVQRPHPPFWIGGNAKVTIKRVVQHGQGWMPFPTKPEQSQAVRTPVLASIADLKKLIELLHAELKAAGRTDHVDICMVPFTHPMVPRGNEPYDGPLMRDEAAQMKEIGVTWLSVAAGSANLKTLLKNIERWGKEVINA